MSLDNQITELQNKKKQIAFLNKIKDLVTKRATDDILTAVAEPLNIEIDLQISHYETGERRPEVFEVFSEDEIRALRGIANKVLTAKPKQKPVIKKEEPKVQMQDKLQFHMHNRHLVGKKVKVAGSPGVIKGLDAPDAVLQMDDDKILKVPLGQLEL